MTSLTFRSSRPHESVLPRAHQDACMRRLKHGPIYPMEDDTSFWKRLFQRR